MFYSPVNLKWYILLATWWQNLLITISQHLTRWPWENSVRAFVRSGWEGGNQSIILWCCWIDFETLCVIHVVDVLLHTASEFDVCYQWASVRNNTLILKIPNMLLQALAGQQLVMLLDIPVQWSLSWEDKISLFECLTGARGSRVPRGGGGGGPGLSLGT